MYAGIDSMNLKVNEVVVRVAGGKHGSRPGCGSTQAYPWCFCSGTAVRSGWSSSALSRLENLPKTCSRRGTRSL